MSDNLEAARALIERLLPGYGGQFALGDVPCEDGCEVWELGAQEGRPALRGSTPVAIACALNAYLEGELHACISHCGSRLELPERLPVPAKGTRRVIRQRRRAYMNYCTVSYSAAWWGWEEWEREIDMMALKGINMPLSVVGAEAVWYYTLLDMGYDDEAARGFICGPAHLAWFLMGNLQSYGGPVLRQRIERRAELGRRIIERELELGMMPIQHGFAGFVPRDLGERFRGAAVGLKPKWCAFDETAQLDPTDPLFERMAGAYYRQLERLMGAHHHYAVDPFHESEPPVDTPEYLRAVGGVIARTLRAFDPEAECVMQSWSIRRDVLEGMGNLPVMILDFNGGCERSEGWWGRPFLLGNLHNFGGRINLHGDIGMIAQNRFSELAGRYPNISGTGLFMEGIGQNPLYYDLAFHALTAPEPVALDEWLDDYALRRYGESESARRAVHVLASAVYRPGTNGVESSSMLAARPALECKKSGPNAGFDIPYPQAELLEAFRLLLGDADRLGRSEGYRYDVADVGRQLLSNLAQSVQRRWADAFRRGDRAEFERQAARFIGILEDADALLATREEFSFDRWLSAARAADPEPEQQALNVRGAATLVTIWGPDEPEIFDYAWREWSGLIRRFYLPRWRRFLDMLRARLERGEPYDEQGLEQVYGREAFRANGFYDSLADLEREFARDGLPDGAQSREDTVALARKLIIKYGDFD